MSNFLDFILFAMFVRLILDILLYRHFERKINKLIYHHNQLAEAFVMNHKMHERNNSNLVSILNEYSEKNGQPLNIKVVDLETKEQCKKWGF